VSVVPTDSSFRVTLLGEPSATRNGRPVHLGSGLRRALFAVLALKANHVVPRPSLIHAVWGQDAPRSASGSVHTYVSELRRALEPDRSRGDRGSVLTTSNAGYQLAVPPDGLDVHRLERLRERSRALDAAGDAEGELATLDEALALWTGEALSGVRGPFAEANRWRLREVRLTMVERRAELVVATDSHDEVVDELVDLVRENPTRERLHGLLMAALFRAGRQTDALEAYRRARAVLVERFGTEPGHELQALHQRVLAGDTTVGRSAGCTGARRASRVLSRARASTPFVGRADAVARLRASVADVVAGRGGLVWIEGGPGSGKTALLTEALAGDASEGCTVSWVRGDEFSRQIPFSTVERCLGDLGAALPRVPGARTGTRRGTTAAAVLEHVRQVVGSHVAQPLLLVLDDLQHADRESLGVWHYLCGLSQHRPLLLVSACRPAPLREDLDLLRELCGELRPTTVPLPPLTDAEARELVERAHPQAQASVRSIVALAGGNPAHLLAVAAAVERHGPVQRWRVVPPPVASVALDHFGHLSPETGEVLRATALLGDACSVEEIESATGSTPGGLVDALSEALAVGVLEECGDGFRFAHPLLRRVLYESVPSSLRLAVYQQFAT
jgi:DNA-binding SARP family transcriptional activator